MSLLDTIEKNNSIFLKDFGKSAIFNGTSEITVIFDNDAAPVLDMDTGGIVISGPKAIAKTSDVSNAKGKTLKIDNTTYKIIEVLLDGTGLTRLRLSRD